MENMNSTNQLVNFQLAVTFYYSSIKPFPLNEREMSLKFKSLCPFPTNSITSRRMKPITSDPIASKPHLTTGSGGLVRGL